MTGANLLDPVFDATGSFTDIDGNVRPNSDVLVPISDFPPDIVQDTVNLFSDLDQFMDGTARSHGNDYREHFLVDVPDNDTLSVGRLSHLPILGRRPRMIGSPWGEDYNAAFDRYYFSPKIADPFGSGHVPANPAIQDLTPSDTAPASDDARNEMVHGAFNINSTSVPAWDRRFGTLAVFKHFHTSSMMTAEMTTLASRGLDGIVFHSPGFHARGYHVKNNRRLYSPGQRPLLMAAHFGTNPVGVYQGHREHVSHLNWPIRGDCDPQRVTETNQTPSPHSRHPKTMARFTKRDPIGPEELNMDVEWTRTNTVSRNGVGSILNHLAPSCSTRSDTFHYSIFRGGARPVHQETFPVNPARDRGSTNAGRKVEDTKTLSHYRE